MSVLSEGLFRSQVGRSVLRSEAALRRARRRRLSESLIGAALYLCALVSVLTTAGIVATLASEAWRFFEQVALVEFWTGTQWTPLFANPRFGIWPLLTATLLIAAIAMAVALPLGLLAAIWLAEYAPGRWRAVIKPLLEVLAGIPTVVYGYFALLFVTPLLKQFLPGIIVFNALSAGLVMGFMILPMVASLSEDALLAVPRSLREGAYALGATQLEVVLRVVVPAALSGIVSAFILAFSRAVGETMIVTIAAGNLPNLSLNPLEAMQTMTAYIAQVSMGDVPHGTLEYRTLFAVGTALFVLTLVLNLLSRWLLDRFREVYD